MWRVDEHDDGYCDPCDWEAVEMESKQPELRMMQMNPLYGGSRLVLVDRRGYYFDEEDNVWRNTKTVAAVFQEVIRG